MTSCNLNTYDFLSIIISIKMEKKNCSEALGLYRDVGPGPCPHGVSYFLMCAPTLQSRSTCTCFTLSGCSEAQRVSRWPAAPPLGPVTQIAMLTVGGSTKPQISPFLGIDLFVTSGTGYNPPWGVDTQVWPCFRPGNWSEVRRGVAHRPF